MKSQVLIAMLCSVVLAGCGQHSGQQSTVPRVSNPQTAESSPVPLTNRFENVSAAGTAGLALDTVTGQWCRTWDWQTAKDLGKSDLNKLPTCLSLYGNTPPPGSKILKYDPATGKLTDPFAQFGGKQIDGKATGNPPNDPLGIR